MEIMSKQKHIWMCIVIRSKANVVLMCVEVHDSCQTKKAAKLRSKLELYQRRQIGPRLVTFAGRMDI
jgi:hypothetical protein